jgi:propanol-preferring alcohol dehydrogenase
MSETMKSLQYVTVGEAPRIVEVPKPKPGPGQVLLKVTAAGVCHSDEFIMSLPEEVVMTRWPVPFILGHEGAGIVAELGEGATGVSIGDSVLVYGPWGCGRCSYCLKGDEMLCPVAVKEKIAPPGLGSPGAMAEYMIVDSPRHLVQLGDLDPVASVSLTDAALTPYHAIKTSLSKLGAGTTAVVIGAGGLGHMAIQILKAISGATVIALDISAEKRALALEMGADYAFDSNEAAVNSVKELTGGVGANAVFDFVGMQPTIELMPKLVAPAGDVQLIGIGNGVLPLGFEGLPFDVNFRGPYWGALPELAEVVEMARRGQIKVEHEAFKLEDGAQAYARLHEGTLRGRAVLVP